MIGAQRLSATLINAHGDAANPTDIVEMCSTPFGDIDQCTLDGPSTD